MKTDLMKRWLEERDAAALSFDVEKFKAFYRKWQDRGVYDMPLPSDEVLEITLRKMVLMMAKAPKEKVEEAQEWLRERGFSA